MSAAEAIEHIAEPVTIHVPALTLARLVKSVGLAAHRDRKWPRPILENLYVEQRDGRLIVAATDSFRLFVADIEAESAIKAKPARMRRSRSRTATPPPEPVPPSSSGALLVDAAWLTRWTLAKHDGVASLTLADGRVTVGAGGETMSRPADDASKYPKFQSMLEFPAVIDPKVHLNAATFASCFRAAQTFDKERPMELVALQAQKPCMFVVGTASSKLTLVVMPVRVS